MKRLRAALVCSLLASALAAPATHGATQVRHFQGEFAPLPHPVNQDGGRIALEFTFKNKRGNKGKFTPRQLTLAGFEGVPLSCMNTPGEPTASALLTRSIPIKVKLGKTPRSPSQAPAKVNRYSYSFTATLPGFTGTLRGRVYKVNGRGPVRVIGPLTIQDLDFPAPGPTNCATNGPRGWQAG